MNHDDAILAALAELRAGQARIEARLDRIEQAMANRGSLSAEDRRRVDALLPYLPIDAFTVKSLRDEVVTTSNVELAAVLDSIGSSRSLGRLLARASEAGYRISRISDKAPTLWRRLF